MYLEIFFKMLAVVNHSYHLYFINKLDIDQQLSFPLDIDQKL
jgi:acyl-CoA thioesterase